MKSNVPGVCNTPLTEKQRLKIYDRLREAHKIIKSIYADKLTVDGDDFDEGAIDAVSLVLYLAEGHFTRPE